MEAGADCFCGQSVAIGPQLRDMWAPASVAVVKYQHAFAVHNRPLGDKPWGQFSFPLQARRRATAAHPAGTT
ncbi:hypothetical protein AAB992_13775 [Burkholderia contaminans]|uniref:hypothetical protein n=1 Tax=Burkholderia contaminans TaxID=488447 RepID=UPI002415A9BC|nr:hypothetical protein [Burkholderia contaminans]WFN10739.1 hypothetical protein LXE92_04925 [Burkholderia contaminans]